MTTGLGITRDLRDRGAIAAGLVHLARLQEEVGRVAEAQDTLEACISQARELDLRLGTEVLGPGLRDLAEKHEWIGEVRGTGAFWALELVSDRATREPLAPYGGSSPAMGAVVTGCQQRGMLPFVNFNRIHVVPPLTTTDEEAREGLAILDEALTAAAG